MLRLSLLLVSSISFVILPNGLDLPGGEMYVVPRPSERLVLRLLEVRGRAVLTRYTSLISQNIASSCFRGL